MNAPAIIPTATASLPQTYEAARTALAECSRIDECQSWADKAAALASYAKQAQDDALLVMATRIKARAARRSGELLRQIEAGKGGRPDKTGAAADTGFTRKDAARDAGMSPRQMHTAQRIAAVPAADFEAQVESPKPPTLTALAQQGIRPKPRPIIDLEGRDPKAFNRALHFVAAFEGFAKEAERFDLNQRTADLDDDERDRLRGFIARIDIINDTIMGML